MTSLSGCRHARPDLAGKKGVAFVMLGLAKFETFSFCHTQLDQV
jgi:hypothetical protein